MRNHGRRNHVLAALALCVIALGCKDTTTKIETLLDDPSRFDQKTVRIAGEVKESLGLLGYGGYRVDDGTGTLLVLTNEGGAPRTGAKIGVEGEFRAAFTIGSESVAALMENRRFTP